MSWNLVDWKEAFIRELDLSTCFREGVVFDSIPVEGVTGGYIFEGMTEDGWIVRTMHAVWKVNYLGQATRIYSVYFHSSRVYRRDGMNYLDGGDGILLPVTDGDNLVLKTDDYWITVDSWAGYGRIKYDPKKNELVDMKTGFRKDFKFEPDYVEPGLVSGIKNSYKTKYYSITNLSGGVKFRSRNKEIIMEIPGVVGVLETNLWIYLFGETPSGLVVMTPRRKKEVTLTN